MINELKAKVKKLLIEGRVEVVLGYKTASDGKSVAACFIEKEADVDQLIWNEDCVYNLSNYLKWIKKKVAVVVKGCDARSVVGLIQEGQVKRENIVVIGIECRGVANAEKCESCRVNRPKFYDILIKDPAIKEAELPRKDPYLTVKEFEGKSLEERWQFWAAEFKCCIKCYACRQVCPHCFCPTCIVDRSQPEWIDPSPSLIGNFSWNIVRAYHLAGRCVDCGECERACPMNIPLRKINKKIEKDIKEQFNYETGFDPDSPPFLAQFSPEDPGKFIL